MRFVQVIGTMSPSYGGPSVAVAEMNAALRGIGVDAVVLTTDNGEEPGRRVDPGRTELTRVDAGTEVHVFRRSHPHRLENSVALFRAIWREARTADVLEMHGSYLLPHVYVYLAARRWGTPFGIQAHGAFEPWCRRRSTVRKRVFSLLVGRRMLRDAAYVLFTSEAEAANAADLVSPRQSFVTDLGVALDEPVEDPVIAAALEGVERERCVLYLGRLATKKRPELLLEAWAAVPERSTHRLVIAGPDGDITRSQLQRRARELGVDDSVHVVGEVGGGRKTWLYERCGLFVLPSQNENFGMTVAEAMAAGCFVLTTEDTAAYKHAMNAGACAVIPELRVEAVADSVSAVLGSGDITAEASRSAREYAADHLSWDATARNIGIKLFAVSRDVTA